MNAKKLKILLLDPDASSQNAVIESLKNLSQWTVEVDSYEDIRSCLDKIPSAAYDLIFISYLAAEQNDYAPIKNFRVVGGNHPVIAYSHLCNDYLAAEVIKAGADDYLNITMLPNALLSKSIDYALGRAQMRTMLKNSRVLEHHMAYHDYLTNLPNRKLFLDRLNQAIIQSHRNSRSVAVMFIDLDGFKGVNDIYGHKIGDLLLQTAAKRLKACIRQSDTVARLGGDEFVIVLNDIFGAADAVKVARKIIHDIKQAYDLAEQQIYISSSIGISVSPEDGGDVETLIKNADIAMYRAKQKKNSYQFFHHTLNEQIEAKMRLEHNMRQAINSDQFTLHYQPIIEVKTGKIAAIEALIRWNHHDVGMIYPNDFLPVAEDTGLIIQLGEWIIRRAAGQLRLLNKTGHKLKIALNISKRQLQQNTLCDLLKTTLNDNGINPQSLIIEITEKYITDSDDDIRRELQALNEIGTEIAIDNFSSGFSPLLLYNKIPIKTVKLNQSLSSENQLNHTLPRYTKAVIDLAHSLNLKTVIEGVETPNHDQIINSLNSDFKQGFLYSKPIPEKDLLSSLANCQ